MSTISFDECDDSPSTYQLCVWPSDTWSNQLYGQHSYVRCPLLSNKSYIWSYQLYGQVFAGPIEDHITHIYSIMLEKWRFQNSLSTGLFKMGSHQTPTFSPDHASQDTRGFPRDSPNLAPNSEPFLTGLCLILSFLPNSFSPRSSRHRQDGQEVARL